MEASSSQSSPPKLIFTNHPKNTRPPPGPQLWAIVLTIAGLYYLWTKILGRPLPSFGTRSGGGHRVRKGHSAEEMAAVRERQQQRLNQHANETSSDKSKERGVRERNVNSGNGVQQQLSALQQSQAAQLEQKALQDKKHKQRQLYLRQKAEEEKAAEERRKDEELGPGWRYRQDPSVNVVDSMNPGGSDGGGYKSKVCTRRGG